MLGSSPRTMLRHVCHPEQASFAQRGIWASRAIAIERCMRYRTRSRVRLASLLRLTCHLPAELARMPCAINSPIDFSPQLACGGPGAAPGEGQRAECMLSFQGGPAGDRFGPGTFAAEAFFQPGFRN